MHYDCVIEDMHLVCTITPDRDLSAPVFCASGMAPIEPVLGGHMVRALGSYLEVQLPDLRAGAPHEIHIRYAGGYRPANRAWMPLGPYLRVGSDVIPLPATPAGCDIEHTAHAAPGEITGLGVLPRPETWTPSQGTLTVDGFAFEDAALGAVADLGARQGWVFRGAGVLHVEHIELLEDGYVIDITPSSVTISASSYGGRFYAGITLLTMLRDGPLPCGKIIDAPRFGWRGQHLDTARHFYEVDTILRLLDLMAMLKLNRFHWHFADDEAFRLEIECVPELWQKTALRGEGQALPGLFNGAPVQGGTYSKADAARIIAHAKTLNIEILPEIEAPAHALAITTLFADTRDPHDNGAETSVQGYARNAVNPAMPRSWEILSAITREVGDLFPFNHIHLGCDELPEDTWMSSPKARALMQEHGLKNTKDLQGWTIEKLARIAVENGQRPAAWEEAAQGSNGGIGNAAILFSWTGQGPGLDAARAGYDVVMTPAQHLYFDMAHTDNPNDWGANWAGYVSLANTINWTPVPDADLSDRIIGVQGAFWSEFTTQDAEMWPMLMPRMLGLAAMAWQTTAPEPADFMALTTLYKITPSGRLNR